MIHYWLKTSRKAAFQAALLFFLIPLLFPSCKSADDEIGVGFLPKGSNYSSIVVDTLDVIAYTVREDSIKIDSLSSNLLGAINDSKFGTSKASLYTQILLREINVDFGTNPTIDSVVLSLARSTDVKSYGNSSGTQDFSIYRMAEIIDKGKSYFSNYEPALGTQIGSWTANLRSSDTVWYEEDGTQKFHLNTFRIRLDNSFGEDFFTNGKFGSNEAFLNFLNGIAIIPETSGLGSDQGSIVPINKYSDNSKLTIYYSGGLRKEFDMNSESQNISTYSITDRNANIVNQLNNPGTHYSEVYLQAMTGSKLKIEIPELLDLVKDGEEIAINEASLTFTVQDGSTSSDFPAPDRLLLVQPSEVDASNAFILDLVDVLAPPSSSWVGHTNYGGNYNATEGTYTFHFNRHLQHLLTTYLGSGEDDNRGFYLIVPSDNPITPSRAVLNTDNSGSVKNLKLKIVYTKL